MENKKRFIQSCEMGGSMYGRVNRPGGASKSSSGKKWKSDLGESYHKFYKDQFNALSRILGSKR